MPAYTLSPKPYPLVVLVGPTASGKSELAVRLARRFNGEIISADSRQIYKGLDLGTGKVKGKWRTDKSYKARPSHKSYFYKSVSHHLIDFIKPNQQYSAALFQRDTKKAIADVLRRSKLPILCGGTAHWINAVVYNQILPNVKPNAKLRLRLEKNTADELYYKLAKLDPMRAKTIDRHNKRRLIRALEIISATGKPVPQPTIQNPQPENYNLLWLGINPPQKTLYQKIDARLKQRIKAGMINEVEQLHRGHPLPLGEGLGVRVQRKSGLSWKRLINFGLEYKYVALYLQKKLARKEMLAQLSFAIKHYSKRQMTWWKKNKEIKWVKNPKQAEVLTKKFL